MKLLPIFLLTIFLLVLDSKKTDKSSENIDFNGVRIIEDKEMLDSINLEDLTKNARKVKPVKNSFGQKNLKKDF